MRRRRLSASSIVFIGRECRASSSCPKYEVDAPGGDDQAVVGQRVRRSQRPRGDDGSVFQVEAGDLGQLDLDVLVSAVGFLGIVGAMWPSERIPVATW